MTCMNQASVIRVVMPQTSRRNPIHRMMWTGVPVPVMPQTSQCKLQPHTWDDVMPQTSRRQPHTWDDVDRCTCRDENPDEWNPVSNITRTMLGIDWNC